MIITRADKPRFFEDTEHGRRRFREVDTQTTQQREEGRA